MRPCTASFSTADHLRRGKRIWLRPLASPVSRPPWISPCLADSMSMSLDRSCVHYQVLSYCAGPVRSDRLGLRSFQTSPPPLRGACAALCVAPRCEKEALESSPLNAPRCSGGEGKVAAESCSCQFSSLPMILDRFLPQVSSLPPRLCLLVGPGRAKAVREG
jgi:hypothetical protein